MKKRATKRKKIAATHATRSELLRVAATSGADLRLVRRVLFEGHVSRFPAVQSAILTAWRDELAKREEVA